MFNRDMLGVRAGRETLGWGLSIVGNPAVGSGCGVDAVKEQVREAEFVMVLMSSEGARVCAVPVLHHMPTCKSNQVLVQA